MKTKYERMNKDEKKKVHEAFKNDKKDLAKKMNRMYILVYLGIIYGVFSFIYDLFISKSKLNYWLDIVVIVFCIIVYFILFNLKKRILNNYVIKNKKRF